MTTVNKFAEITPGTWINSEILRGFKSMGTRRIKFYWGDNENTGQQDSVISKFDTPLLRDQALVALINSGIVTQTTP